MTVKVPTYVFDAHGYRTHDVFGETTSLFFLFILVYVTSIGNFGVGAV